MSEAGTPDFPTSLVGVREFSVDHEKGRLHPLHELGFPWKPGEDQRALCSGRTFGMPEEYDHDTDGAPVAGCTCGLHSYYNLETLHTQGDRTAQHGGGAAGVVSAWGRIILCEYGFRAQYMRLEAIICGRPSVQIMGKMINLVPAWESLARSYGVPLIWPAGTPHFMTSLGGTILGEQPYKPSITSEAAGDANGYNIYINGKRVAQVTKGAYSYAPIEAGDQDPYGSPTDAWGGIGPRELARASRASASESGDWEFGDDGLLVWRADVPWGVKPLAPETIKRGYEAFKEKLKEGRRKFHGKHGQRG